MGKLIKLLLLSTIALSLIACGKKPAEIKTVYVTKVVFYVPAPPVVEKPEYVYPLASWESQNSVFEAIKLLSIDTKQLYNYSTELLTIIDKYSELAKETPNFESLINDKTVSEEDKSKLRVIRNKIDNFFKKD